MPFMTFTSALHFCTAGEALSLSQGMGHRHGSVGTFPALRAAQPSPAAHSGCSLLNFLLFFWFPSGALPWGPRRLLSTGARIALPWPGPWSRPVPPALADTPRCLPQVPGRPGVLSRLEAGGEGVHGR